MSFPHYYESFDYAQMLRDFPIGDDFTERYARLSTDEIRARQDQLFRRCVARGWEIPFYQRLWRGAGLEPGDVRGLDDLGRLPVFGKGELMQSLAEHPPYGDYHGWDKWPLERRPTTVIHTTSGTTGRPQVVLFSPKAREVQALLVARIWRMQGLRPGDVVHSVYGHGMINGGHFVREAALHYTNCLFLSAGTGKETRSVTQIELMRDLKVTVVVGFVDYIRQLAETAREMGLEPGRDLPIRAGEIYYLPPRVPHSPQRMADSIGLVIERKRLAHEMDGLQWYCERCNDKLYEEFFILENIETQFPAVFDRFYRSSARRTCASCGHLNPAPARYG